MIRPRALLVAAIVLTLVGCGGNHSKQPAPTAPSMPPVPVTDYPTDTSADGLAAFIAALDYQSDTWAPGTPEPRLPAQASLSPHGLVQIWYNQALRQSWADGHAGTPSDPHAAGSMAVKELHTDAGVVGHASLVRTDTGWLFYCDATEPNRCYSGHQPGTVNWGTSFSNCSCHAGGTIVTAAQMPPP
jgi:hypothetical protein